jgi:FkbM family methyltransferase
VTSQRSAQIERALVWAAWRLPPRRRAAALWRLRRHELAKRLVDTLVAPGDVVCDVGANWGLFAARLAVLVGPQGEVHAFEPGADEHASLNAIRGGRRNVVLHPIALSDDDGEIVLHVPQVGRRYVGALASVQPPSGPHRTERVPRRVLDDLMPAPSRLPSFVKIDVEGHELAVLRGAATILTRARPTLLVESERRHGADPEALVELLRGYGYKGWSLTPDGLRPVSELDLDRDQPAFAGTGAPPDGYINDFLFAQPELDLDALNGGEMAS